MKVTFEVNEVLPKLVDVASVINSKNSIAILCTTETERAKEQENRADCKNDV